MATEFFDSMAAALEEATTLQRLEARGTLRLALKEAGLAVASVSSEQMAVVLQKVMPRELASRGVSDAEEVCNALAARAAEMVGAGTPSESPEDVFRRLAG